MCSLPDAPGASSGHPVDSGQRTEAIVLAALARRGYRVLTPFGTNQRYDLGDRFLRVWVAPTANGQVKGIRWASEYELPE
jgi:hypothetical protein